MLSKKSKYGLQALMALADAPEGSSVLIADLAEEERIPKKFLEAILLELKKQGILQSKKGKGGGYQLAKHPSQIKLGQVLRILDGPLAPVSCVSQSAYKRCDECKDEYRCGIRLIMKDVRDAIANILDNTSLEEMNLKTKSLTEEMSPNYHI